MSDDRFSLKERIFWEAVRRALLVVLDAIEERYDFERTRPNRKRTPRADS